MYSLDAFMRNRGRLRPSISNYIHISTATKQNFVLMGLAIIICCWLYIYTYSNKNAVAERVSNVFSLNASPIPHNLLAIINDCHPLIYTQPENIPEPKTSLRPMFVRSASSLRWLDDNTLVCAQDDVNYLGRLEFHPNKYSASDLLRISSITLPTPPGASDIGNKAYKFDFEALVVIPEAISPTKQAFILCFGSGSKPKFRDVILYIDASLGQNHDPGTFLEYVHVPQEISSTFLANDYDDDAAPRTSSARNLSNSIYLFHANEFYDSLRNYEAFSGNELNIEGSELLTVESKGIDRNDPLAFSQPMPDKLHMLRFYQRSNGEMKGGKAPVSASIDVRLDNLLSYMNCLLVKDRNSAVFGEFRSNQGTLCSDFFRLYHLLHYALGSIQSTRLTFTDISAIPNAAGFTETLQLLAVAEASFNTTEDGEVKGVVTGFLPKPYSRMEYQAMSLGEIDMSLSTSHVGLVTFRNGSLFTHKAEGIALVSPFISAGAPISALIVIDPDNPTQPSQICDMTITI